MINLIKRFCRRWAKWVDIYRCETFSPIEAYIDGDPAPLKQVFIESQLTFRNWVYESKSEVHYELPEPPPAGSLVVARYKTSMDGE